MTNEQVIQLVTAFNDALNARDVDAMMRYMTPDCVFENTYPAPDGTRYVGQVAVRAFWNEFFRGTQSARFYAEEIFAVNDRCVMRWRYAWGDSLDTQGHVRGIDIYAIKNDLIAEKLAYVKG